MYNSRDDFGRLFSSVNIKSIGAEIGVQNGFNAERIWRHWPGRIILVDKWNKPRELKNCLRLNWDKDFKILIGDSVEQAARVADESLDWVYIDAGHTYEELKADFEAWFPKVRKGGIVSGHDYGDNDLPGVKQFIDEYIANNPDVDMQFTTEDYWEGLPYQSWWFIKK